MGRRVRPLQAVLSLLGLQHATLAAPVLCRSCGAYIGDTADVVDRAYDKAIGDVSTTDFAAGDGDARRLQRFRNPEGQEFSVVPLHSYQGVTAVGPASTEASFFPPYAWSMASCARCKAHVGWEFSDPHAARRNAPQAPASSAIPGAPLPATAPVDAALDGLRGVCLDFAKGFWSYRWCYRGEIRQFHKEVDGTTTLAWSLGTYAPSAQGRQSNALHTHRFPGASEALPFHPHFHEGGQRCDEHGKARGTEVQLFCCASERTGVQGLAIREVVEPSTCRYIMRVCVPGLCKHPAYVPHSLKHKAGAQQAEAATPAHTHTAQGGASGTSAPARFLGAIADKVVVETSEDLEWVHGLRPVTALAQ